MASFSVDNSILSEICSIDCKITLAGQRYLAMANIDDPNILIYPLSNHFASKVRQPDETITDVLILRTALLLRLATYIFHEKIAAIR